MKKNNEKDLSKIIIISLLLVISLLLSYYFHFILKSELAYSHFFYVPITLASLWWSRKGIVVAILLALMLPLIHILSPVQEGLLIHLTRSFMFVVVGTLVALLSQKSSILIEKLRQSRDYQEKLINHTNTPIIVWDPEFGITRVNRAFEHLTGYTANEMVDKEFGMLFPEASRQESLSKIECTLKGEYLESVEVPVLRKDGDIRLILWNSANIYGGDGTALLATIAQGVDITERKRAEEALLESRARFRSIFEDAAIGIGLMDREGHYIMTNLAFQKMIGYSSEELSGMSFTEITYGDDVARDMKHYQETMAGELEHYRIEKRYIQKDGQLFWGHVTVSPVRMAGSKTMFAITMVEDITECKNIEEMRLENERLVYANKAKSEFLTIMSHELRTPLTSIIGYSMLIREKRHGKLNEKQKFYADRILTSSEHLLDLINSILDLAKIEAGKLEMVIEDMSVPDTLIEILETMQEKAAMHDVVLETEFDPDLHFIKADRQKFKQILFNLLSNAVKFSKEDGGIVTISTKKDGDMAKISVSDTGIGIKEEDMPKLFKKFGQLDREISRKYEGTGLGLAITRQLVELQGGTITVESIYNEGSTFTFSLPMGVEKKDCLIYPLTDSQ